MDTAEVVIVGAGLAGAKAAQTLREEGLTGRIVLIGAETRRPYERPPLSKGFLKGETPEDEIYVHAEDWYSANDVELLLARPVTGIDRAGHRVELADGEHIGYRKLLLATGASPRRLDVPGGSLAGVFYLRDFFESDVLRSALREGGGGPVVIVGGGWIGLEVASAARGYGAEVTVIEPQPTPLHAVLGQRMGEFFAQVHRDNGVRMLLGQSVERFVADPGRLHGVVTSDGTLIETANVIVGIGAIPNTELAVEAGLAVDDGVLVDQHFRTDDPDIFAAGDVARVYKPFYETHVRVEHWANALDGGPAAARGILGREFEMDPVPFFFTDQYDLGVEYAGWYPKGGADSLVIRGDPASREFYALWLNGRVVVAGMHVNQWDEGIAPVQRIIRERGEVEAKFLADPEVPWADLV
ncbi:FAD-dependent oxidoreductase [Phytomonospora sp. NPDC050363]|uniref:NAD(P)/FAD-dependent oxidoreductase n=1 Tax=Phytomonospora sp. NPDC050363 TaxID=3155642 RepID=UPI0033EAD6D5